MEVNPPEGGERSGNAEELIFKARAFLLQLFDYGIDECFCHSVILAPGKWAARRFIAERVSQVASIPAFGRFPLWGW